MTAKELIRLLQESMPGVEIETVPLNKEVTQPLDAILERVHPGGRGPVMVLGLEASNPSSAPHHPVLQALNLGRAEWPAKLPRPVVFWVPEYLLGLLGREAPDLLDWRSDTLYFPEPEREELQAFEDSPWVGGYDGRLSEPERRARIAELRARLAAQSEIEDPVILDARVGWLRELGNHLLFLGELLEAEKIYQRALKLADQIGSQIELSTCYIQLGRIARESGDYGQALDWFRKSLQISEKMGNRVQIARGYYELGIIAAKRGAYDQALDFHRRALQIGKELGHRAGVASSYQALGIVAQRRGNHDEALELYKNSLHIKEELGNLAGMASSYHQLGMLAQERGDQDQALDWYRKSLQIKEELGNRVGMALTLGQLGALEIRRGHPEEGLPSILKSLEISLQIGSYLSKNSLHLLRRQRKILGKKRFGKILREHLDEEGERAVLALLEPSTENSSPPLTEVGGRTGEESRGGQGPSEES